MASKQQRRHDRAEGIRQSYMWILPGELRRRKPSPLASGLFGTYSGVLFVAAPRGPFVISANLPDPWGEAPSGEPTGKFIFSDDRRTVVTNWATAQWLLNREYGARAARSAREGRSMRRTNRARGMRWRWNRGA